MISGLHDGRIKALYLVGENPAHTEPNAKHVEEGFEHLEFVVAQDLFLNELTAEHADVVFPASSFAEKDGTFTNTERRVNRVRAGVPCPGRGAGRPATSSSRWRVRWAPSWPEYPDAESVWNELADLSPNWYGIRYDRLEEQGHPVAVPRPRRPRARSILHAPRPSRPNGKGKLWPVEYQPPIELPDSEYPLTLSTGPHALPLQLGHDDDARGGHHRQAGGSVLRDLRRGRVRARASPTATGRGSSRAAATSRRARSITDRVYPGLVWMALHFAQAKVNWLTHDVGDPLIGTPEYKVSAVRVEPI